MSHEAMQSLLRQQPFQPVSVHMSNGDVFKVRHPDAALLLRSSLLIALPGQEWPVTCALDHIADVRPLEAAASGA